MLVNLIYRPDKLNGIDRQRDPSLDIGFIYSDDPQPGYINVLLGSHDFYLSDADAARSIFVLTEPPEVERYSLERLSKFWKVLGPPFRYLAKLRNLVPEGGLVPWRIGVAHEAGRPKPTLDRNDIANLAFPTGPQVSAVISGKTGSRRQRARIELSRHLETELDNFELFGRDTRLVEDKYEAHMLGTFHLAVENSYHRLYFTEKLTDALLAGNHVFYGGHPSSVRQFDTESITLINPLLPPWLIKRRIKQVIENYDYESSERARSVNRALVLDRFNLHSAIARAVQDSAESAY